MLDMNSIDIQIPTRHSRFGDIVLENTFELLDKLITDIILWLAYGIALLCGFKFIIYLLNGITSKSHMGSTSMDDTSFIHGKNKFTTT
jgi:hypothetical protein